MSDANKESPKTKIFVFPSWHNRIPPIFFLVVGPLATVFAIFAVWYWFSPKFTDAGYMPEQPVAYSHKLHAGELKIDCRYCHVAVEKTAWAGVPPTATCMNCHTNIKTKSPKLALVRESYASDKSIPWVRIHKIADYAYFNHSAHVRAGVGCESCHGRIDTMVEVWQEKPLSMGWCYECHQAGQEAFYAAKSVRDLLSKDLRAKRTSLMENEIDGVGATSAEVLIKQKKAREEVKRLDNEIARVERAPKLLTQLKRDLAAKKQALAAGTADKAAAAYLNRQMTNISTEIKRVETLIKTQDQNQLAQLQSKSEDLFKKFVKVANLRPSEKVTAMGYELTDTDYEMMKSRHMGELMPPINCSGCHR